MSNYQKMINNLEILITGTRNYVFRPSAELVLMRSAGQVVEYYPAMDQWRCGGKLHHGNARDLLKWIDSQENNQ
jgi:hypothetical protein